MAVAVVAKSKDKCVLFFEGVNEFNSKIQDSIRAVITQTKLKDLDCLNTLTTRMSGDKALEGCDIKVALSYMSWVELCKLLLIALILEYFPADLEWLMVT